MATIRNLTRDAETFTCNVYLVSGTVSTLVDAGAMPGIVDAVRDRVDTLDRIVITHQHGDHVEQLPELVEAFDPEVMAYADHRHRTAPLTPGETVRIGDEDCEVVYTPGHADDHVSLVSDRALFSGDVVVHDDGAFTGGSFGRTDIPGQSRERLIESIHTLLDRMPDGVGAMYSGHGGTFEGDVRAVVERALERAERREPKYPDE
ncbi:MAG: MBL fold metallo-hydrolase [Halobacteriaceae archaeon]